MQGWQAVREYCQGMTVGSGFRQVFRVGTAAKAIISGASFTHTASAPADKMAMMRELR